MLWGDIDRGGHRLRRTHENWHEIHDERLYTHCLKEAEHMCMGGGFIERSCFHPQLDHRISGENVEEQVSAPAHHTMNIPRSGTHIVIKRVCSLLRNSK